MITEIREYITKGDKISLKYDLTLDGQPYDLEQFDNILIEVREGLTDRTTLVEKLELGDGISVSGNELTMQIDTTGWPVKVLYADARFELDGDLDTLFKMILNIRQNITA